MSAVVIKLSSLNSPTLRNTVTAWYTRAGVSRERAEGQMGREERREGEKERNKKKLWVQGLMMGPEAMADSVATPAKTTLKYRKMFTTSSVRMRDCHNFPSLKTFRWFSYRINMAIRVRKASCGSILFPRARGILNFVPPLVFVCDLYS